MRNKSIVCWTVLGVFLLSLLFTSCGKNAGLVKGMQQLEEDVDNPSSIEEIKESIEQNNERIDEIILSTQQNGVFWKLLGTRYLNANQYGKALEAFQNAVSYYPANQNLYYYIGVCAGYLAKASLDFSATGDLSERERYFELSESAYLRALEIEPRYVKSLYGLSVLYVFDLNRYEEAIPYLETVLSIEKKHVDAMFVLARAFYCTKQYQKAADMYDVIIETTADKSLREDAERNKKVTLDALYS